MPASPKLTKDYALFQNKTNELLSLLTDSKELNPKYQRLIAEVIIIQLSYLLDNTSEIIFAKLIAGASYIDGSFPKLLYSVSTIQKATDGLLSYGRGTKTLRFFSWADGQAYKRMLKYTIKSNDSCYLVIDAYSSILKEIKDVRNYAAHKSNSARKKYKIILNTHSGAIVRAIPVGQFLTSSRFYRKRFPNPINWYIKASQIFIKDLVRAP